MGTRLRLLVLVPGIALLPTYAPPTLIAAAAPTAANCLHAWNRAPSALRAATARRHPPDTPAQMVAGALDGSDPACGVVFATSRNFLLLVAGRWSQGRVASWSTRIASGGRAAELLRPREVESVVFRADGTLAFLPATHLPSPTDCARAWNKRPREVRLALARKHPRRIVVGPGVLTEVRDGVLRNVSGTGCRVAFLEPDGSFGLIFGQWDDGRVTSWVAPRLIAGPTEARVMAAGHANATVRADGTLHVFS